MKGNLFAGRKLLLQSLRNNENSQFLHVEYFKFELAIFEKIKQRRQLLTGETAEKENDLEFIDDQEKKLED